MKKFNSSYVGIREDLLKYISGENNKVLDVGCATGVNGKYLLERGVANMVVGVELDREMADVASASLNMVLQGNLNDYSFQKEILDLSLMFDFIILGDILEHLINPEDLLQILNRKLVPGGKVIISLPNIAHLELFIQIFIKGTWPRNERGIFDKTHLRWYTRRDAIDLLKQTGYEIHFYQRKYRARDAIGSKFNLFYSLIKLLNKDLMTFQHIIVGRKNE